MYMSRIYVVNDTKIKKRSKGRPKTFDRDDALNKALGVFCEYGYQGTSLAQLTDAMGMNPPSVYGAFGDKQQLFIEVLSHYHAPYLNVVKACFKAQATTLEALGELFQMSETQHVCRNALGCLIVNSGINRSDESSAIGDKIKEIHETNENLICERLERGQKEGDVAKQVNARKLARYINGILQGAAVTARGQQSPQAVKDLLDEGFELLRSRIS